MARVFVSYRRDDASGHAGRIYDRLALELGADQIFMDVDDVKPGVDFVRSLEQAVASCDVLIAVIGPEWVSATQGGTRRLDNPQDWVRVEVSAGLKRNDVIVVPVLVGGAVPPTSADLPRTLSRLARVQAHEVSDKRFSRDASELVELIKEVLAAADRAKAPAEEPKPAAAKPAQAAPKPTAEPAKAKPKAPAAKPSESPATEGEKRERPGFKRFTEMARGAAKLTTDAPATTSEGGVRVSIHGRPRVGSTLTCRSEGWADASRTERQWLRCPPGATGADAWSEIPGATSWIYTPAESDLGHHLAVRIAGGVADKPLTLTSAPIGPVAESLQTAASRFISAASRRISGEASVSTSASSDRPWACDLCGATFPSLEEADDHPDEVHPDVPRSRALGAIRRRYIKG